MSPEPTPNDDAYDDDPPTVPRGRAPKISGVRPAAALHLGDDDSREDDATTDVDCRAVTLSPADEEGPTARLPSDVEEILRALSALGSEKPTVEETTVTSVDQAVPEAAHFVWRK